MSTTVKVFVSLDLPATVFNWIEFAKVTDDIDGAVAVCVVQSSKVVKTGYVLGSRKAMVDSRWCKLYNNHPKLNNIDVQVSSHYIKDLTNKPWDPKNNVHGAHILCSIKR